MTRKHLTHIIPALMLFASAEAGAAVILHATMTNSGESSPVNLFSGKWDLLEGNGTNPARWRCSASARWRGRAAVRKAKLRP